MTEPQTLPAENVFGIAKKMHLELEKLTLVDHGAVISMVNSMAQRRELSEKLERQQAQMQQAAAQQAAQDAAMQEARAAHESRAAAERERARQESERIAARIVAGTNTPLGAMRERCEDDSKRLAEKTAKDAGIVLVAG